MAETTIEWTATPLPDGTLSPGFTFNPWIGCQEVSPACDNCYAREFMTRKTTWATAWSGDRFRTSEANWKKPLAWNRKAEKSGVRAKVFCASLADVFDNKTPPEWRDELWHLIADTPHLDWLLLTKRPQNIAKMLPPMALNLYYGAWPWPNVWLGTTVENQEEADRRIPCLLAVPAVKRFLSCEPLLGPVDLTRIPEPGMTDNDGNAAKMNALMSPVYRFGQRAIRVHTEINWVICGGESGPNRRRMNLAWMRSLRDQCAAASVPFFGKQDDKVRALPADLMVRQFPDQPHD